MSSIPMFSFLEEEPMPGDDMDLCKRYIELEGGFITLSTKIVRTSISSLEPG